MHRRVVNPPFPRPRANSKFSMRNSYQTFRHVVGKHAEQWLATGLPSRQVLDQAATDLAKLRQHLGVNGLWTVPPGMVTATLDDGLGQGLAIIELFSAAVGIRLISLGLLQSPEAVVAACRRHRPAYVGVTILQFDTEADLAFIAANIPAKTRIIAGGPVFNGDPAFAQRTGTHYAAKNVAAFLRYMIAESADAH